MKQFSVLMSVYWKENPEHLTASLSSVFSQTNPPTQVLLVQDGKLTSELDAVIADFENHYFELDVVSLDKNSGLGAALNEGLRHCKYDLVARMDSDDIASPFRFERQLLAFEKNEQLSIVGSWVSEFESIPTITRSVRRVPITDKEIRRTFGDKCPINHPSTMFRKSDVLRVGGYRSDYLQEDYDLWGRMLASGCVFSNIPECLVMMRAPRELFARRGGLRYAISEAKLQRFFLRLGLISFGTFLRNVIARFIIRLIPNHAREIIYQILLRH